MMTSFQVHIIAIALVTSLACVLPGIFLVLRGVALMSDAISHAVLLGIVLLFFVVKNLHSPLLLVGAALSGVAMVAVTELLISTKKLKKDAAIGLVFPLFFSVAIILIAQYAQSVHLDTDMVLLGQLVFAPLQRLVIFGIDCGPTALWLVSGVALLNFLFVVVHYQQLRLIIFDETQAIMMGCKPQRLYYALLFLTSITAVAAFEVVGAIVVVALMITPAATGFLLSRSLVPMIAYSVFFALLSAYWGYVGAWLYDVSVAGSIATMSGVFFVVVLATIKHKFVHSH